MELPIVNVPESVGEFAFATFFIFKKVSLVLFVSEVISVGSFAVLFVLLPVALINVSVQVVVCTNALLSNTIRI